MYRFILSTILICGCLLIVSCNQINEPTSESASNAAKDDNFQWTIVSPEDKGLDSKLLDSMDNEIMTTHKKINSFLIVKEGNIIFEKYYNGRKQNDLAGVYSVTKSIVSALTGIAIDKKLILGLETKASDVIPEYFANQEDSRKKDITVKHILTMTGGLESVDKDFMSYINSPDFLAYTINKPLVNELGASFDYNTGLPHLLSGMITKTANMSTKDFADKFLFGPLGITKYIWNADQKGYYNGGTDLYLTPRDMAKFGYLYLNKGQWQGQQIVPATWVEASTNRQISLKPGTDYGYLFWISETSDNNGENYFTYEANGYGGQLIRVIPDLNLMVVVTTNIDSQEKSDPDLLIRDYIIPAIARGNQ